MMMKDDDNDDGENDAARRSYSWPASSPLKVQTKLHTFDIALQAKIMWYFLAPLVVSQEARW